MAQSSIKDLILAALSHHQAGRFAQARQIYLQVLQLDPNHADGLHLLGLIAHQQGQHVEAVELVGRAVSVNATEPVIWFNYGNVLIAAGRDSQAITAFRTAIQLRQDYADAFTNLSNTLERLGRIEEAAPAYESLARLKPKDVENYFRLGWAWHRLGHYSKAVQAYRQVIQLSPLHAKASHNLAEALQNLGQTDEAIAIYRRILSSDPENADALNNLATGLRSQGAVGEAAAALEQAVARQPSNASAHSNLALAQKDMGDIASAARSATEAVELNPLDAKFHSNLLLTLQYSDTTSPQDLYAEHVRWARRHADPLMPAAPVKPSPHQDRRIRVGYVSADFWRHPVAAFFEPILAHHDRGAFEVFCYSSTSKSDETTARLKSHAEHWREVQALSDEALAAKIRDDKIDLLIDLAGHTGDHRLLALARRPAAVQATYLGYPGTTGMPAIDYRITDVYADPPGIGDQYHSEKLVRLARCFLCYQPPAQAPSVAPPPFLTSGHITFGSFNNAAKISQTTIRIWADVLKAVPGSQLLLKAPGLMDRAAGSQLVGGFTSIGIPQSRIKIINVEKSFDAHLGRYGDVDISLDTFPYNGTTTTCESLWMGVPVLALAGATHVSRVGVTLLTNANLGELVADSPHALAVAAARLANDRDGLVQLRAGLRDRMRQSPLTDAVGFTRELEGVYHQMIQACIEKR